MTSLITQSDGTIVLPPRDTPDVGELKLYIPIIFHVPDDIPIYDMFEFVSDRLPPLTPSNKVEYVKYSESEMDTSSAAYKNMHKIFSNMIELLTRQLQICVMCSSTILTDKEQKAHASPTCCGHTAPVLAFISYMITKYGEDFVRENYIEYVKSASCFFEKVAYTHSVSSWNRSHSYYTRIDDTNYPIDKNTDNEIFIFTIYCDVPMGRNTYHHFFTVNKWIEGHMYVMIFDSWAGKGSRDLWGRIMLGTDFKSLLKILNTPITSQRHNDVLKRNIYYESYFSIPHIDDEDLFISEHDDDCHRVSGFRMHQDTPMIRDLLIECMHKFKTPIPSDLGAGGDMMASISKPPLSNPSPVHPSSVSVPSKKGLVKSSYYQKKGGNAYILTTKRIKKINKKRKTYKNKKINKKINKKRKTNKIRKPIKI